MAISRLVKHLICQKKLFTTYRLSNAVMVLCKLKHLSLLKSFIVLTALGAVLVHCNELICLVHKPHASSKANAHKKNLIKRWGRITSLLSHKHRCLIGFDTMCVVRASPYYCPTSRAGHKKRRTFSHIIRLVMQHSDIQEHTTVHSYLDNDL